MDANDILISQLEEESIRNRNIDVNYYLIHTMLLKSKSNLILEYVSKKGINNIIIYGGGVVGNIFYSRLKNLHDIKVVAIVDRNSDLDFSFDETNVINVDNINSFKYDVVIVTPILSYNIIKKYLESKQVKNIVSLLDIFKLNEELIL